MADVVEGELVEDKGDNPVVPSRLAIGKIGGLNIRRPSENLPNLNLMIYGDSGVGKTLLCGTAAFVAELSPVLFIDVESGTLTLSQFDDTADIDVVRVSEWKKMQSVYDDLYAGKFPYRTVVIDSLTEMQKLAMNSQLGAGADLEPGGNMPEFKDWHINTEQMRRLVRAFRDLPINTIFTALAMDLEDPRNPGKVLRKPAFTKKLANEIPAFFDILFYMYVKETREGPNQRLICTDKTANVVAKCRVQGVPQILGLDTSPNMEMIYDLLIRNPRGAANGVASEIVQQAKAAGSGLKRKS